MNPFIIAIGVFEVIEFDVAIEMNLSAYELLDETESHLGRNA
jgi:hypothetical protein